MAISFNESALAKLNTVFEYAQQAAQKEAAGDSSVIRINREDFTCDVSHADAPKTGFGLLSFRSKDQQELNNATRALFKQTVLDALGVKNENELPKSVKDAMRLSDYHNRGRPLTARRIIAVVSALPRAMAEMVTRSAVDKCIAHNEAIIKAYPNEKIPKLKVSSEMREKVTSLLMEHGHELKPKALQVLANYAIFTVSCGFVAESADEIIGTLAKQFAKLDDFEYGDTRFKPLNDKLTEVYQDKLDFYMDPERASAFNSKENVSETLSKDSYRAKFEINGKDPNAGLVKKDDLIANLPKKFKEAVPEKFQKPLSMFMCQDMSRIMAELLSNTLATYITQEGVVGLDYKGGELMPFKPDAEDLFISLGGLTGNAKALRYRLEVSDDKKSATVTVESNYELKFCVEGAGYATYNVCGGVKYSEQFKFDLSGDELKMTSHLTSQQIEP